MSKQRGQWMRLLIASTLSVVLSGVSLFVAVPGAHAAPVVSVGSVTGDFFSDPVGSGVFNATPAMTPKFSQTFPVINFNPPSTGFCSNAVGVNVGTRPFTDVVPQSGGTCTTVVAQGNGFQAGVGTLNGFQTVFSTNLIVSSQSDVTFSFFSDDGWIAGIGPGPGGLQPTQVSGANQNPPPSGTTAFHGYKVVGAFNGPSSPVGQQTVVHFPAAGTYPAEFDYVECCGGALSFTLQANGSPIPPSPPALATQASPGVAIGGTISDTATLSNGIIPTGTITFDLFGPGDTTCATVIHAESVTVNGNGTYPASSFAPAVAGTYRWVAHYSGDANNAPVDTSCSDPLEGVTVAQASPSITTLPSGNGPAGGSISDSATLVGGFNPAGSVVFTLYGPGDTGCQTPLATRTATVGGGSASSGSVPVGGAGTYNWTAVYGGDPNNTTATSPCGAEAVNVVKASPTISTTPSASVPAGGSISDSATLTGGFNPAGSVVFTLYGPGDTGCQTPIATRTSTLSGGTASSGPVTVGAAGTYSWKAAFGGDGNNNTATSPCGSETVDVTKASPTISTTPSGSVPAGGTVSDSATVSGGASPSGQVAFLLFPPSDPTCAQAPFAETLGTLSGGMASSGNITVGGAGTYHWVANYLGDASNTTASSPCSAETVDVTRATPTIATTPSGSVPAGGTISDSAMVSGGFAPGGNVVFTLYGPGDTTCKTPIASRTTPLSGGTAASGMVPVGAAGTYNWVAAYSGDANNNPATSPCGSEPVVVTPQRLTGRAFGLSANVTLLGAGLITVAPTPDTGNISTTASSRTTTPCVATLTGIVGASVLCANVTTVAFPGKSTASASASNVGTAILGIPTVTARVVQSTSTTTCAGSSGTTTIDFLSVGSVVVIAVPTQVAPNTTINVGVVKLVLNEQLPFSTPDKGLTVNAIHATVNALGLAKVDLIVASSKSDIGNCP